eukprot:9690650-Ditylum_brightwellii.AAC.1
MAADKVKGKEVDEKDRRAGSYGMPSFGYKAYKEGVVLAYNEHQQLENSNRQYLVDGRDDEWYNNAAVARDDSVREEEFEEE